MRTNVSCTASDKDILPIFRVNRHPNPKSRRGTNSLLSTLLELCFFGRLALQTVVCVALRWKGDFVLLLAGGGYFWMGFSSFKSPF